MPKQLVERMEQELDSLALPKTERERQRTAQIEAYLDRNQGHCWLRRKVCAAIVRDSLLKGHGDEYQLHAFVIMPNHVHVLARFLDEEGMGQVLGAWKDWTAHECNKALGRTGPFWHDDFYDRYIRDASHYENARRYIVTNPVRANLVKSPWQFPWLWVADHRPGGSQSESTT